MANIWNVDNLEERNGPVGIAAFPGSMGAVRDPSHLLREMVGCGVSGAEAVSLVRSYYDCVSLQMQTAISSEADNSVSGSERSVSSVSTSRSARRRAKRRAGAASGKMLAERQGYCYLGFVKVEYRSRVAELGPEPTLQELYVGVPAVAVDWAVADTARLELVTERMGGSLRHVVLDGQGDGPTFSEVVDSYASVFPTMSQLRRPGYVAPSQPSPLILPIVDRVGAPGTLAPADGHVSSPSSSSQSSRGHVVSLCVAEGYPCRECDYIVRVEEETRALWRERQEDKITFSACGSPGVLDIMLRCDGDFVVAGCHFRACVGWLHISSAADVTVERLGGSWITMSAVLLRPPPSVLEGVALVFHSQEFPTGSDFQFVRKFGSPIKVASLGGMQLCDKSSCVLLDSAKVGADCVPVSINGVVQVRVETMPGPFAIAGESYVCVVPETRDSNLELMVRLEDGVP